MPNGPWGTSTSNAGATPSVTPIGSQVSIDTLNSEDILSKAKKPQFIASTRAELAAQVQLDAQASSLGVSASAYDTSVSSLMTFLNALSPVRTNEIIRSQEIDNAAWTKQTGVTITADTVTAPDGTTTADKIKEAASTQVHFANQADSSFGATKTFSIYAKAAERSWLFMQLGGFNRSFNLSAGTVGSSGSGVATITAVGNGWYRCTLTGAAGNTNCFFAPATGDGGFNYAGTAGNGIYVWGAQRETGSTATSYIPTTSAAVLEGGWSDTTSDTGMGAGGGLNLQTYLKSVATNRAALQKALTDKVQANAAYSDALARSTYNLIKNGNSEDPNATGTEAVLVSTGAYYTGTKGRAVMGDSTDGTYYVTPPIPCVEGDQFYFEAMAARIGSGGGHIYYSMVFFNTSGTAFYGYDIDLASATVGPWVKVSMSGAAPAGSVSVAWRLQKTAAVPSGNYAYFDNLYACRKIAAGMLQGDAIQTSNYAESGGVATAGARMDISGTALKVVAGGLQIGSYTFTDYFWRQVQAIDGTNGNRVVYRGNVDPTTRGGAPNISCLTVQRRKWGYTLATSFGSFQMTLQPSSSGATDNLDAMRAVKIQLYGQSAAGTSGTLTSIGTWYKEMNDRSYGNFGSDTNTANASVFTYDLVDDAIGSVGAAYPAMLVTLINAYGPSAANCFYAGTGNANGSNLVNNGTSWPAGLTGGVAGGGGGGGGAGGGACPAPWVKISLASGLTVDAADLYDGAPVVGVDDLTLEPSVGVIRNPAIRWAQRIAILLEDGTTTEFSPAHRLMVEGRGWTEVRSLQPGDSIVGQTPAIVHSISAPFAAEVVSFTVEGCATYFSDGLLSHNAKIPIT